MLAGLQGTRAPSCFLSTLESCIVASRPQHVYGTAARRRDRHVQCCASKQEEAVVVLPDGKKTPVFNQAGLAGMMKALGLVGFRRSSRQDENLMVSSFEQMLPGEEYAAVQSAAVKTLHIHADDEQSKASFADEEQFNSFLLRSSACGYMGPFDSQEGSNQLTFWNFNDGDHLYMQSGAWQRKVKKLEGESETVQGFIETTSTALEEKGVKALVNLFVEKGVSADLIKDHRHKKVPGLVVDGKVCEREFDGFVSTPSKFVVLEAKYKAVTDHIEDLRDRIEIIKLNPDLFKPMGYDPKKEVVGALAYHFSPDEKGLRNSARAELPEGHYVLLSPNGSDMEPTFGKIED